MAASYSSLQKESNWVNMVNHSIKLGFEMPHSTPHSGYLPVIKHAQKGLLHQNVHSEL